MKKTQNVTAEVMALNTLSLDDLWVYWDRYFESRPQYPNRSHMIARIAYKLQEQAYGGLDPKVRQRLEDIGARQSQIKQRRQRPVYDFTPGTVFLREWGDHEHRVSVNGDGEFEYEGEVFKSLTAVARRITGGHWSGPVFFGVKGAGR